MSEREQMRRLADKIRVALDRGTRVYTLQGAEMDWVVVALRRLADGEQER